MTNAPDLDADVWKRPTKAKPKQAGKLKEFRKKGFEHYIICMLAASKKAALIDPIAMILTYYNNNCCCYCLKATCAPLAPMLKVSLLN